MYMCLCVYVYNTKNMFKFRERKTSVLDEHVSVCVCKRDISEREIKKERNIRELVIIKRSPLCILPLLLYMSNKLETESLELERGIEE